MRVLWSLLLTLISGLLVTVEPGAASSSLCANCTSCAEDFAKLSRPTTLKYSEKMYAHIHSQWDETVRHEVVIRVDGAHVGIGSLTIEDPTFILLLAKAVRSGEVAIIEGGRVIGPKALNFITHITSMAPPGRNMKFTGSVSPMALHQAKESQIAASKAGVSSDPASRWTEADVEKFEASVFKMKILEACQRLWKTSDLRQCRNMKFELNSDRPEEIVWSRN